MKYENGTETKNLILEKSQELFLKKGFKKTSIREIAKKVHITSGALYKHFPSKDAILEEIVQPVVDKWWALCERERQKWEDDQDKIKTVEDLQIFFQQNNTDIFRNFIKNHYDILQFILFKSADTKYEKFFDEYVKWETDVTLDLLEKFNPDKKYLKVISDQELKYIMRGYISMLIQAFNEDFNDDSRNHYYKTLEDIYREFWKKVFTVNL